MLYIVEEIANNGTDICLVVPLQNRFTGVRIESRSFRNGSIAACIIQLIPIHFGSIVTARPPQLPSNSSLKSPELPVCLRTGLKLLNS